MSDKTSVPINCTRCGVYLNELNPRYYSNDSEKPCCSIACALQLDDKELIQSLRDQLAAKEAELAETMEALQDVKNATDGWTGSIATNVNLIVTKALQQLRKKNPRRVRLPGINKFQ